MLCSANFLRAIVVPILPQSSAPSPAASPAAPADGDDSSQQAAAAAALQEQGSAVCALCALLYRLARLPGQRQRVLIGLAVRAELAQRLWFSYLRSAQAARGERALPRCVGWGWVAAACCYAGGLLLQLLGSAASQSALGIGQGGASSKQLRRVPHHEHISPHPTPLPACLPAPPPQARAGPPPTTSAATPAGCCPSRSSAWPTPHS